MQSCLHTSVITFDTFSTPRSDSRVSQIPYFVNNWVRPDATDNVSLFASGIVTKYLLNRSVAVKIYVYPCGVMGRFPYRSICQTWKGPLGVLNAVTPDFVCSFVCFGFGYLDKNAHNQSQVDSCEGRRIVL